jgi:hypothetical protein
MDHHADLIDDQACILEDAGMYPNVRGSNPKVKLTAVQEAWEKLELS